MRFRFANDAQPYDIVSSLAQNLQKYPPHVVLAAPVKLYSPDLQAAHDFLSELLPEGVRVELVAQRLEDRCNNTDPWYGGSYARLPLDKKMEGYLVKSSRNKQACRA